MTTSPKESKPLIKISIKRWLGNWVKYERDNEGLRDKLDEPYQKKGSTVRFTLPTGKKKTEIYPYEFTDEQLLKAIQKRYSNFRFQLHKTLKTNEHRE